MSEGHPNPSAYLVGLPAAQNVYACSGSCPTGALTDSALRAQTLYVYDQNGNNTGWHQAPQSLGHLTARRTFLRWNQPGTWSDPRYSDETYTYDAWGNRTGVTHHTGEGTSTTLASGARTTTTGYDPIYRTYALTETNALNHVTTWDYSTNNGYALGLPTAETDPNHATTSVTYDAYGRLLTLIRPYDSATSPTLRLEYRDNQPPFQPPFWVGLTQKTGGAPFIRRQVYDGLGRQIQVQTAEAVLDSGPQDVVVDRRFDGYDRAIQQTVPYTIESWTGSGSPYRGQQLSQPSSQTGYDVLGRPSVVTAPDGARTEHRYGVVADGGTVLAWHDVLDPNRHRLQTRSDALGRQVQVVEISGNCGSWGYTCSGAYTTPWTTGTTTSYRYDVLDRLTTVTRGSLVTTIGYDAAGRKTQLQDPDMGPWTYAYDGAGNLVRQTDAREQRICFYYDALNRLTGKHYRPDDACPSTPGASDLPVRYYYDQAYGAAASFPQAAIGRRTLINDPSGYATFVFDQRGRLTREYKYLTGVGGFESRWTYDAADQVKTLVYPVGPNAGIGETVTSGYHPQQLVNSVTGSYPYLSWAKYDAAGRLTARSLGPDTVIASAAYFPWTTPNGQGRLQRLTAGTAGATLLDLRYPQYDALGNLEQIEDRLAVDFWGSPQVQTFTYDERNRLTSAGAGGGDGQGSYSESAAYDPVTGRLSRKAGLDYSYEAGHPHAVRRVTGSGGSARPVTIRARGSQAYGGWPIMKLSVNGQERATWTVSSSYADYTLTTSLSGHDQFEVVFTNDAWQDANNDRNLFIDFVLVDGRLVQAEGGAALIDRAISGGTAFDGQDLLPGGEGLYWTSALRFVVGADALAGGYDATGNLTSRLVDGAAQLLRDDAEQRLVEVQTGTGAVLASFAYDADGRRVLATVTGVTTAYPNAHFEYEVGSGITRKYYHAGGQRVAMRENGTLVWLLSDQLGSTTLTAAADGTKRGELRYRAWGETRYAAGSTPTSYRYTGQRQEAALGLYYYGARWYDPTLGRFLQPDPIVPEPGNPLAYDRYAYALNNPVRYTDPTGYFTEDAIKAYYGVDDVNDIWWWNDKNYEEFKKMLLTAEAGDVLIGGDLQHSDPFYYTFEGSGKEVLAGIYFSDAYGREQSSNDRIASLNLDDFARGSYQWNGRNSNLYSYGFIRWANSTPTFYIPGGYAMTQVTSHRWAQLGIQGTYGVVTGMLAGRVITALGLTGLLGEIATNTIGTGIGFVGGGGPGSLHLRAAHMAPGDWTVYIHPDTLSVDAGRVLPAGVAVLRWRQGNSSQWIMR